MPLLSLRNAELAYGLHPLLDNAQFAIDRDERVGLIGRNGTGKSSLLKVIAGRAALDDGELVRADGLKIALVEQEPELPHAATLRDSVTARGQLHTTGDARERWAVEARLHEYLHRHGVPGVRAAESAPRGERLRAALALAHALEPGLLLRTDATDDI